MVKRGLKGIKKFLAIMIGISLIFSCIGFPTQIFAALFTDEWSDSIEGWVINENFKAELLPDDTGIGNSLKFSTKQDKLNGQYTFAEYTLPQPVNMGGLCVVSFKVKMSGSGGNEVYFDINGRNFFTFHRNGQVFLDSFPGSSIYEEPAVYSADTWHEIKLVVNRRTESENANGVMEGNQYGVYFDGVLMGKSGGNAGRIPKEDTQIKTLRWRASLSRDYSTGFYVEMDDLKVYTDADPLPNATVALNETFDISSTAGFDSILHKVGNGITGITGALGPFVTTLETNLKSVADPSEADRSLSITKQMTPVEHTYNGDNIALIARKEFQPIEIPKNGNATIEFDVKFTDVNSVNADGGWISRYLLINDTWQYKNKVPSGIFFKFGEDKLENGDYAVYNGTAKTNTGYREAQWHNLKIYFENDGTNTYYTLYIDSVPAGEKTNCGAVSAIKSIAWGNQKKSNPNGIYDVGVLLNNLKVYNNKITFASGAKPSAVRVSVLGENKPGADLTANYAYHHEYGKAENGTTFRWLRSSSYTGAYDVIESADGAVYKVTDADINKYIKCEVTPKDSDGTVGAAAQSKPVQILTAAAEPVLTADEKAVKETKDILSIDAPDITAIVEDITLPTTSANGCSIEWDSDNIRAFTNDGVVTRDGSDAVAYLTAKITKGSASDTKKFKLRIKGIANPLITPIDLSQYFSMDRFGYEGDTGLWRIDANHVYRENVQNGIPYQLGSFDGDDLNTVLCAGQTIALEPKNYTAIHMLGSGSGGGLKYTITYTDNSTEVITSDPDHFGEMISDSYDARSRAVIRAGSAIGPSNGAVIDTVGGMFKCSIRITSGKTVKSITLPSSYKEIYAMSASTDPEPEEEQLTIAFAGDSITYGVACDYRNRNAFSYRLRDLLGSRFTTYNVGISSTTMQGWGGWSAIKASNPDIVVIMLGTNDASYWNAQTSPASFKQAYVNAIANIKAYEKHPKVYACLPPTQYSSGVEQNGPGLRAVMDIIKEIAAEDPDVTIIDVNKATSGMPQNVPDGLHPNTEGHIVMAKAMYEVLKNYGSENPVDPDIPPEGGDTEDPDKPPTGGGTTEGGPSELNGWIAHTDLPVTSNSKSATVTKTTDSEKGREVIKISKQVDPTENTNGEIVKLATLNFEPISFGMQRHAVSFNIKTENHLCDERWGEIYVMSGDDIIFGFVPRAADDQKGVYSKVVSQNYDLLESRLDLTDYSKVDFNDGSWTGLRLDIVPDDKPGKTGNSPYIYKGWYWQTTMAGSGFNADITGLDSISIGYKPVDGKAPAEAKELNIYIDELGVYESDGGIQISGSTNLIKPIISSGGEDPPVTPPSGEGSESVNGWIANANVPTAKIQKVTDGEKEVLMVKKTVTPSENTNGEIVKLATLNFKPISLEELDKQYSITFKIKTENRLGNERWGEVYLMSGDRIIYAFIPGDPSSDDDYSSAQIEKGDGLGNQFGGLNYAASNINDGVWTKLRLDVRNSSEKPEKTSNQCYIYNNNYWATGYGGTTLNEKITELSSLSIAYRPMDDRRPAAEEELKIYIDELCIAEQPEGTNLIVPLVQDNPQKKQLTITNDGTVYTAAYKEVVTAPIEKPVTVIIALYDDNDKPIKIAISDKKAIKIENPDTVSGTEDSVTASINATESQDAYIRAFAWDTLHGMTPLLNSEKLDIK